MPGEVLQRATQLQWAEGALPPMGRAAAATAANGADASAGGGSRGSRGSASAEAVAGVGPLEGEEQQTCVDLYRRAYLVHCDIFYPPAFIAAAALVFGVGGITFWAGLLLLPLLFAVGAHLLLIKGEPLQCDCLYQCVCSAHHTCRC